MFQLTRKEKDEVVANCDHLNKLKFSPNLPFVFTEHGAVMLASMINSVRAIIVNIQMVRIFSQIREVVLSNKDILLRLEQPEQKLTGHDENFKMIFGALKQLLSQPAEPRRRIGFRTAGEAD